MIQFDFSKSGFSDAGLSAWEADCLKAHQRWMADREEQIIGWCDLLRDEKNVGPVKKLAQSLKGSFKNILVLGIGGSSQGLKCLHQALMLFQQSPQLRVVENPDPITVQALLETIDFSKTLLIVISKSGKTIETMALFDLFRKKVKPQQIVVITEKRESPLFKKVTEEKLAFLEIPKNIGGRFSVFTSVGLFPLACLGADIDGLLQGASKAVQQAEASDLKKNPLLKNALIHFLANRDQGKTISVMMGYGDCFKKFGPWYSQLWAESLGKDGKGQTPLSASGPKDQHAIAQLFLDGPKDKIVTFLKLENIKKEPLWNLMEREWRATAEALHTSGVPSVSLTLAKPNAEAFGELLMSYQLQTAFIGHLMAVNPYNQPAVERIKKLL